MCGNKSEKHHGNHTTRLWAEIWKDFYWTLSKRIHLRWKWSRRGLSCFRLLQKYKCITLESPWSQEVHRDRANKVTLRQSLPDYWLYESNCSWAGTQLTQEWVREHFAFTLDEHWGRGSFTCVPTAWYLKHFVSVTPCFRQPLSWEADHQWGSRYAVFAPRKEDPN